jgi:hypothetical protein
MDLIHHRTNIKFDIVLCGELAVLSSSLEEPVPKTGYKIGKRKW